MQSDIYPRAHWSDVSRRACWHLRIQTYPLPFHLHIFSEVNKRQLNDPPNNSAFQGSGKPLVSFGCRDYEMKTSQKVRNIELFQNSKLINTHISFVIQHLSVSEFDTSWYQHQIEVTFKYCQLGLWLCPKKLGQKKLGAESEVKSCYWSIISVDKNVIVMMMLTTI